MTTPADLRDAGMDAATHHADPRVILAIDAKIAELNASRRRWSANDARDRVTVESRGLVGARVRAAAMRRPVEMERVGQTPSDLDSTHHALIAVWRGVNTEADGESL